MPKRQEVYKCEVCGNIVELLVGGAGELVCCGEPMNLLEEKTAEFKLEKHVPVVEKSEHGIKVTVGSTLHPMTEEHCIEWIEVVADCCTYVKFLKPNDEPVAHFCCIDENVKVREHCNVHGLWKSG